MSASIRTAIVGRDGKLGAAAAQWIRSSSELELVASIGPTDDWKSLEDAEVVLEVTRAGLGHSHGMRLLEMGLRPVIGTSGISELQIQELNKRSLERGLGGIVVPNFSLGMLAMRRALEASYSFFKSRTLSEAHRAGKADAPSGTAKALCALLGTSDEDVTSVRIDGLTAAHEVRLEGEADLLSLRHVSLGMESFREGLLASMRYASKAEGIGSGLELVLAEACKLPPGS